MIGLFHWWQARCIYFWTSVQRERNCIWLFLFKFDTRERVIIYAIFNPVDAILKRVWVTMLSTPSPFRLTDNMEVKTTSYFACNIQFSKHEPKQYTPRDTRTMVIITYILEQKKEDFFYYRAFLWKKNGSASLLKNDENMEREKKTLEIYGIFSSMILVEGCALEWIMLDFIVY